MNLAELKQVVDTMIGYVDNPEEITVYITTSEPSVGSRSKTGVRGVHLGFDWEMGQCRIEPEEFLLKDVEKERIVNEFRNIGINETIRSYKIGEKTIHVLWGDITKLEVDAIVNAANSTLLGGGGVDGAIHRKAGRELLEECKTLCGCETGDAKVTKGYNLPVKHIIHTVGPIWDDSADNVVKDFKSGQLSSCYEKCLVIANNLNLSSIAFPCISTGIYHFPKEDACKIAIKSVCDNIGNISDVVFCCYESTDYTLYCRTLDSF